MTDYVFETMYHGLYIVDYILWTIYCGLYIVDYISWTYRGLYIVDYMYRLMSIFVCCIFEFEINLPTINYHATNLYHINRYPIDHYSIYLITLSCLLHGSLW